MTVNLSTFGATQDKIAALEQQQTQQQTTDTTQQTTDTTVTDTTQQQDNTTNQTQDQQQQEPDFSSSSFSLGAEESTTETKKLDESTQQHQQQTFNIDEEIKKLDRKELLKKAGVSDFAIEMDEHLARGGKADEYLAARAVDYNSIGDDVIVKKNLEKQFPLFTPAQIDLFFNRKYGVSEDALVEDKEFAELQLKADAHNIRQQFIQEQSKFKLPEAIIPQNNEAYKQWEQQQNSQTQLAEQINSFYAGHEATKTLHESKRVAINVGEGVPPFNAAIDKPEMITQTFVDGGKTWQKLTSTPTGEPDVQKQQLIALFSFNPQKLIQDIFNYGKQYGVRGMVGEGQNAHIPNKVISMNQEQKTTYGTGKFGDKAR